MSVLGELPDDVVTAMFLRDGYPQAVICKVAMRNGCIGIGIVRQTAPYPLKIEALDAAALADALEHVADAPPDYTELHEHIEKMKAAAAARAIDHIHDAGEEVDHDLQASLGQPAKS